MQDFSYFQIDIFRLEEEWANHVQIMAEHVDLLSAAREQWERAKAQVEVAKAELDEADAEIDLDVRKNPQKYGLDKIVEKAVEKTVLIQAKHKEAFARLMDCKMKVIKRKRAVDDLEGAVEVLEHKKKAISDLVVLQGRDYFSTPSLPHTFKSGQLRPPRRLSAKVADNHKD